MYECGRSNYNKKNEEEAAEMNCNNQQSRRSSHNFHKFDPNFNSASLLYYLIHPQPSYLFVLCQFFYINHFEIADFV